MRLCDKNGVNPSAARQALRRLAPYTDFVINLNTKKAGKRRFSVSKKVYMYFKVYSDTLIGCREIDSDFAFCEREPYRGTASEQKAESAKTAQLCGF